MKVNNIGKTQLVSAITWAMVIIITAVLLRGVEQAQTVFFILLGGATTQMFHLANLDRVIKENENKNCSFTKTE
jgi:hypothetical protein